MNWYKHHTDVIDQLLVQHDLIDINIKRMDHPDATTATCRTSNPWGPPHGPPWSADAASASTSTHLIRFQEPQVLSWWSATVEAGPVLVLRGPDPIAMFTSIGLATMVSYPRTRVVYQFITSKSQYIGIIGINHHGYLFIQLLWWFIPLNMGGGSNISHVLITFFG